MQGDLSETGLGTVLRELARSGGTGALHLDGPPGSAKVFIREGEVYFASSPAPRAQLGARLVGAGFVSDEELDEALAVQERSPARVKLGALLVDRGTVRRDVIRVFVQEQILDAVFDLARWNEGSFEFFRGDAVSEDLPVQIAVEPLLLEVDRRLAEWQDIRGVIPSLDAVPDFAPGGSTTRAALEPDEFTVLTSVDGRRSVRELAHDLGYSQFDAARLVYGLSLLGVIGIPNGQPAGTDETGAEASTPDVVDDAPATAADPDREELSAEEADDVDVGRALEEALFGGGYFDEPEETEQAPPAGETGTALDEAVEGDLEQVAREAAAVAAEPEEERDEDEPVGADDLEPEVWTASIDVDDAGPADHVDEDREPLSTEPEPVSTEPQTAEPQTAQPEGAEPQPTPAVRAQDEALSDDEAARDELMALMDELGQEETEDEAADEPEQPAGRPAVEESTREEPVVAPTEEDQPDPRVERGDVSELLRELSRLAGGGQEPVAPSPEEDPEEDEAEEPAEPDPAKGTVAPPPRSTEDTSGSSKKDQDEKKSTFRRLFGSR